MKTRYLFLFLIFQFSVLTSNAQNWSPIQVGNQYNYGLNSTTQIDHLVKADTIIVNGSDTVFHLNTISKECLTCPNAQPYAIVDTAQFLRFQVFLYDGGDAVLYNPDSLVIQRYAHLNDTWTYDAANNISATVVLEDEILVFGALDSVKNIALSSNDTIVLSKHHGILSFPDSIGTGSSYLLTGINGPDVGLTSIMFREIFDFQVGDIFQYQSHSINPATEGQSRKYTKVTITSVTWNADTISYTYDQQERIYSSPLAGGMGNNYYSNSIGLQDQIHSGPPFTGIIAPITPLSYTLWVPIQNAYVGESYTMGYLHSITDTAKGIVRYDTWEGLRSKTYGFNLAGQFPNSLYIDGVDSAGFHPMLQYNDLFNYNYDGVEGMTMVEGLGVTEALYSWWEGWIRLWMEGFVKGGDTTGTIRSDSWLLGIDAPALQVLDLYPNPASNQISVVGSGQLSVFDLRGRLILKREILPNEKMIDISSIPVGMYMFTLENEDFIKRSKVLFQR